MQWPPLPLFPHHHVFASALRPARSPSATLTSCLSGAVGEVLPQDLCTCTSPRQAQDDPSLLQVSLHLLSEASPNRLIQIAPLPPCSSFIFCLPAWRVSFPHTTCLIPLFCLLCLPLQRPKDGLLYGCVCRTSYSHQPTVYTLVPFLLPSLSLVRNERFPLL